MSFSPLLGGFGFQVQGGRTHLLIRAAGTDSDSSLVDYRAVTVRVRLDTWKTKPWDSFELSSNQGVPWASL